MFTGRSLSRRLWHLSDPTPDFSPFYQTEIFNVRHAHEREGIVVRRC